MPRKPLKFQNTFPYHVTARSNNCEWFFLASNEIWEICSYLFDLVAQRYHSKVYEFVLMSNHFHLLIETPEANLGAIMNYFMREFSRSVCTKTNRINHIFGGRYKGSLISNPLYFAHVYKYILRNPVEVGLSTRVETYAFSTFQREIGKPVTFPIEVIHSSSLSEYIPKYLTERTHWLNTKYDQEQAQLLRNSLKRTSFNFPTHHRHQATVDSLQLGRK